MAELLGGLSWTAGASTTLSQAGGFARATATAAATPPRITKGPVTLVNGVAYRFGGSIYLRTASGPVFFRVASTAAMPTGDYFQAVCNSGSLDLSSLVFTSLVSGPAYIGIVTVNTASGEYSEVDAALTMINSASAAEIQKLASGGAGSLADASRKLIQTSGTLALTNQQLKESGAGFWADMARQGGTVIS